MRFLLQMNRISLPLAFGSNAKPDAGGFLKKETH